VKRDYRILVHDVKKQKMLHKILKIRSYIKLPPYTVCLLSFGTGIIKSICVKEMTLLLFSFRHRSLVTVHTDLHGQTASGCLCRSRPLQWCLMYLSRLSGCLETSQRGTPSSGISLLGTKSNQQVLNLANTEGG